MQIQITTQNSAGAVARHAAQWQRGDVALRAKADAGGRLAISADGVPQTGAQMIDGKKTRLSRAGKDLQLEIDGETMLVIEDFYAVEGAVLDGSQWSFSAAADGLAVDGATTGIVSMDSSAAAAAAAASGAGTAAAPSWALPAIVGGVLAAAAAAGGGGGSESGSTAVVPVTPDPVTPTEPDPIGPVDPVTPIDTTAPLAPVLMLGAGVADGASAAEAMQAGGVVEFTAEAGASVTVSFTRGVVTITKTVIATGLPQGVVLSAQDLLDLGDGTVAIDVVATDADGNASDPSSESFELDTQSPSTPTVDVQTTNDPSPVLTGTADAGNTVEVSVGGAVFITTADGDGFWSVDTGGVPESGVYTQPNVDESVAVTLIARDPANNQAPGIGGFEYDGTPPVLIASTPADDDIAVAANGDIVLTFSEAVLAGVGSIVISDGAGDVRTIDIADATQVTISGNTVTINAAADFAAGVSYSVTFAAGVLRDAAGNDDAGLAGNMLDFTTAPAIIPPPSIQLASSNWSGFAIEGAYGVASVANIGDVNGDELDDVLVGQAASSGAGGRAYVVFGKTDGVTVQMSDLDAGIGGFAIVGAVGDGLGNSVAGIGDFNGDGLADIVVGAPRDEGSLIAGNSYVVFGKTDTLAVHVTALTGSDGLVIQGQNGGALDGYSVAGAGDVNGDGFADVIIGAPAEAGAAGRAYVVYGKSDNTAIDLSDLASGTGGIAIDGAAGDRLGDAVSNAGDVNGDGYGDLIVSAPGAGGLPGKHYVVFGSSNPSAVSLSTFGGGNGFAIVADADDSADHWSVSNAGDINGDGLADVIVGARLSDQLTGRSYVVFGKSDGATVNLADVGAGLGGFVINGEAQGDQMGVSVSGVGDVNGDGLADYLVGANGAGGANGLTGRSYLVYGKTGTGAVELSAVAASNGGFVIDGAALFDGSGASVSAAGDVNGDGLADLLVAAPNAGNGAGRAYVILGQTDGAFHESVVAIVGSDTEDILEDLGIVQTLVGGAGDDSFVSTAASVLYGGAGKDRFDIDSAMINALSAGFGAGGNVDRLARIDGGAGIDNIRLVGGGLTFNLSSISKQGGGGLDGASRIRSVEHIDIAGTGTNTLVVSAADIRDIGSMNVWNDSNFAPGLGAAVHRYQLMAYGTSDDIINVSGTWIDLGYFNLGGTGYRVYNDTVSAVQLIVSASATCNITLATVPVLDTTGPLLMSSSPADADTGVAVGSNIVLIFDEAVKAGVGYIVISSGPLDLQYIAIDDTTQVTFSGSTITINPSFDLGTGATYTVEYSTGVILDVAGNGAAALSGSVSFQTEAPVVVPPTMPTLLSVIATGVGGYVIDGEDADDGSGYRVANAGDVNGDGLDDLLVSTFTADSNSGRSYVVYGKTDSGAVDLRQVHDGIGGFAITGEPGSGYSGISVAAAGDVNGDGLADVIVGAALAHSFSGPSAGRGYVVFGKTDTDVVSLADVVLGSGGFTIDGIAPFDGTGHTVASAGDVNGDGRVDLIVTAPETNAHSGTTYVVYGKSDNGMVHLSALAAGSAEGFAIVGQAAGDRSGNDAQAAGDVNGDGYADLIIGAPDALMGTAQSGRSYVVFGGSSLTSIDLSSVAAGNGGFVVTGALPPSAGLGEHLGTSVGGAGDVNGDGLADLVIGASGSHLGPNGRAYVVFGKTGGAAVLASNLSAGTGGGFVIEGTVQGDADGFSVSTAGDINGDGLSDLIIGSYAANADAGRSYVVFGKTDSAAVVLTAIAAGIGGFAIDGEQGAYISGFHVSAAGDTNGDGLADLIVSAPEYDDAARGMIGRSYVIFGATDGVFSDSMVDKLGTSGDDVMTDSGMAKTLVGGAGNDTIGISGASVIHGGAGDDRFDIESAATLAALSAGFGQGGNVDRLARIDGGSGLDSIGLSGSGFTFDLTLIANQAAGNPDGGSRISSIEHIDLSGTGNNTLVLRARDVMDITGIDGISVSGRHQLGVDGNVGDVIDLEPGPGTAGWTHALPQVFSGMTYEVWHHDTSLATLYVNPDVSVI